MSVTKNFSALAQNNYWHNIASMPGVKNITDEMMGDILQRATYDTNTAAHVNDLFGSVLYAWYNQEHKFYSAIPQVDRFEFNGSLGDVIPKSMRVAHSPVQLDTHSEGGSVSTARTMSIEEFSVEVRRSETVFEMSDLQQIESVIEDAVGMDELWELQQEQLDLAVDRDALADPAKDGDSNYSSRNEIVELDRAIASQDEENNADDVDDVTFSDDSLNYGSIDRNNDAWGDAYVDHNGTSGNRQLTRDLMDDFLNNLGDNGDVDPYEESVILTGRTTANVLSDLMADSTRGTRVEIGDMGRDVVGDTETLLGLAGTTRHRQYDGIPIVANQTVPTDGIGRIFVIPLSTINGEPRIAIENYAEPYVEMAGRDQSQGYLSLGNYNEKALFLLNHELVLRDPASCGKLRDLSE